MNKHKIKLALALLIAPFALSSITTSALAAQYHHKQHHYWKHHGWHHSYHCCYSGSGLSGKVVHRLRSNMTTADASIMVTSRGHTVILCGRVLNNQQKYMAVQITRYTPGVHLVVDALYTAQP